MVSSLNNDENLRKSTKRVYYCPRCKEETNSRVHRSFFVKNFLFWLPLRRYACYKCKRKFYIWI